MECYEFCVIFIPNCEAKKKGEKASILVGPAPILAKDQDEAKFLAARAVPAEYATRHEELRIRVRPF